MNVLNHQQDVSGYPQVASFSCPQLAEEGCFFNVLAELELKTDEKKTIPNEIHLQLNKELTEEMWEKSLPPAPVKRTRAHVKAEKAKSIELEAMRKKAMNDVVKVRRTYSSTPEEIRLRQEIRTRRDHNKDWIRRWQDKSCKFRVLNLNNMMNVNKVNQEELRMEDMMKDVIAINKLFDEKLKEREARIAARTLVPSVGPGPIGLIKAEKMLKWKCKVKEVIELSEANVKDLKTKAALFQRAIVRMYARQNGLTVTGPLIK